ncbi:MAG TPA: hypothetical protein VLL77_14335, partial [Anaerolineales bacterium]|nr:hypothetical protein [Anaerolineales bacterium]
PDGRFLVLWGNGEDGQVTGIHLLTADLEAVSSLGSDVITAASWLPSSSGMLTVSSGGLTYLPLEGPPIMLDPAAIVAPERIYGWIQP